MQERKMSFDGKNLSITDTKGKRESYTVENRGYGCYLLTKPDGEAYSATRSACRCKGYQRWKHCKHSDALRKLALLGKL